MRSLESFAPAAYEGQGRDQLRFACVADGLADDERAAGREGLEADLLRPLPVEEALSRLRELPGIGLFSAEFILLRGVGEPDHLPTREPRLARAVARAYGPRETPNVEELEKISENWRPYRTCVAPHPRATVEEEAGETVGDEQPQTGSRKPHS